MTLSIDQIGKAIGATFILLLMTQVISAQPGMLPTRSGHPEPPKEQRENDKAVDRQYQSQIKRTPDAAKKDPWGDIRPAPPAAAKNKQ